MNLQDLKSKGIKEFTVKNGEARAVNPYEIDYSIEGDAKWMEFSLDPNLTIPPLCPSVADGIYEVGQFEEVPQFKGIYGWEEDCDIPASIQAGLKTRTVIRLKQQTPENHSVEVNDMVEGKPERLNDYASRYAHLQDMPVVQPVERTAEEILRKHADNSSPVFSYEQTMKAMEEYASQFKTQSTPSKKLIEFDRMQSEACFETLKKINDALPNREKEYARIQIKKDRERIKENIIGDEQGEWLFEKINKTPVILD